MNRTRSKKYVCESDTRMTVVLKNRFQKQTKRKSKEDMFKEQKEGKERNPS